jgi:hypothetical protein
LGRAGAADELDRMDNHGHRRTAKPEVSRAARSSSVELRTVVPPGDNSSMPPVRLSRGGQQQGLGSRPGAFAVAVSSAGRRRHPGVIGPGAEPDKDEARGSSLAGEPATRPARRPSRPIIGAGLSGRAGRFVPPHAPPSGQVAWRLGIADAAGPIGRFRCCQSCRCSSRRSPRHHLRCRS